MSERPPKSRSREGYMRDRETGELRPEGEMRESAKKMMEEELEVDREKEGLQSPGRRKFLKRAVAGTGEALTGATVGGAVLGHWWVSREKERRDETLKPEEEKETELEKEPELLMPHEQLARGEDVDLTAGIEAVFETHRAHLTDPEKSGADMEQAAENIQMLDMQRFVQPFWERDFSHKFAYMIAIQETRGRNLRSHSGAGSVTGIMPYTAERYGYTIEELQADPAKAAEVTAQYLADERRERFGRYFNEETEQYDDNNIDMLLHAYNGGGGLFEFTASVSREERTPENFYTYMEEKINTEYQEITQEGYYLYEFDTRAQNLSDVSGLFEIPIEDIKKANPGLEPTEMQHGDKIKIPIENATAGTWRQVFGKEFETLYYVPELSAKYAALKELGLVSKIEAPIDTRIASAD